MDSMKCTRYKGAKFSTVFQIKSNLFAIDLRTLYANEKPL